MPSLILMTGPGQTRQVALNAQETRIGRDESNDLVVDVDHVSRAHACIMVEGVFVSITDLGSKNGTFVNGTRVLSQILANGDTIRIGDCDMKFVAGNQEYTRIDALRMLTDLGQPIDIDRKVPAKGGPTKS